MNGLDTERKKFFQEKLNEHQNTHERRITSIEENEDNYKESLSELSSYDNHLADTGTELFFSEHDAGLKTMHLDELSKINSAQEKLKNGTYGICTTCQQPISDERLSILPHTPYCIHCANEETHERKKKEEALKSMPISSLETNGIYGKQKRTDPLKDLRDMDILEDLMRFGSGKSEMGE